MNASSTVHLTHDRSRLCLQPTRTRDGRTIGTVTYLELVLPLQHADTAGAQDEAALLDGGGRGDSGQGLACPTRQHNDP